VFAVCAETAVDVPGTVGEQVPVDFDEWAAMEVDPTTRPPALTTLALVGGRVAGVARLYQSDGETVYHAHTGVRREFRGRGIGRALKLAQLRAAREAGYRFAVTDNHVDNAPVARLNSRLGYEPFDVKLTLVGPD
jgi:predicted GNAT family acetyltransferase